MNTEELAVYCAERVRVQEAFVNSLCAALLGSSNDVQSEQSQALIAQVRDVARDCPELVLQAALYTRLDLGVRNTANLLVAAAGAIPACHPYLRAYVPRIAVLPTDFIAIVHMYRLLCAAQIPGAAPPRTLPAALRAALVDAFPRYSEYQLAKHASATKTRRQSQGNGLSEPSLKNLVRTLHIAEPVDIVFKVLGKRYPATPLDFERSGLPGEFDVQRAGERMRLAVPETWETVLSAEGNTAASWERLIEERNLPFMAMLRNLRNILRARVNDACFGQLTGRLRSVLQVVRSKQLPFQFLSAFEAVEEADSAEDADRATHIRAGKLRSALNIAVETAARFNVPRIVGATLVLVDVGERAMGATMSKASSRTRRDAAVMLAALACLASESYTLIVFDSDESHLPARTVNLDEEGDSVLDAVRVLARTSTAQPPPPCSTPLGVLLARRTAARERTDTVLVLHGSDAPPAWESGGSFTRGEPAIAGVTSSFVMSAGAAERAAVPASLLGWVRGERIARARRSQALLLVNVNVAATPSRSQSKSASMPACYDRDDTTLLRGFSDAVLRFVAERGRGGLLAVVRGSAARYGISLERPARAAEASARAAAAQLAQLPGHRAAALGDPRAAPRRTVKIFVSSPFRDFHGERDALQQVVFPAVRAALAAQGSTTDVVEVDLRWGAAPAAIKGGSEATELCCAQVRACDALLALASERGGVASGPGPGAPSVSAVEIETARAAQLPCAALLRRRDFLRSVPARAKPAFLPADSDEAHRAAHLKRCARRAAGSSRTLEYAAYWDKSSDPDQPAVRISQDDVEDVVALVFDLVLAAEERVQHDGHNAAEAQPCEAHEDDQSQERAHEQALTAAERTWSQFTTSTAMLSVEHTGGVAEGARAPSSLAPLPCLALAAQRGLFLGTPLHAAPEFVGRRRDVALLSAALAAALARGGGCVVLKGEPGSGKTATAARALAVLASATCEPPLVCCSADTSLFEGSAARAADAAVRMLPCGATQCARCIIVVDSVNGSRSDTHAAVSLAAGAIGQGAVVLVVAAESAAPPRGSASITISLPLLPRTDAAAVVRSAVAACGRTLPSGFGAPDETVARKRSGGTPAFLGAAAEELRLFGQFDRIASFAASLPENHAALAALAVERAKRAAGALATQAVVEVLAAARAPLPLGVASRAAARAARKGVSQGRAWAAICALGAIVCGTEAPAFVQLTVTGGVSEAVRQAAHGGSRQGGGLGAGGARSSTATDLAPHAALAEALWAAPSTGSEINSVLPQGVAEHGAMLVEVLFHLARAERPVFDAARGDPLSCASLPLLMAVLRSGHRSLAADALAGAAGNPAAVAVSAWLCSDAVRRAGADAPLLLAAAARPDAPFELRAAARDAAAGLAIAGDRATVRGLSGAPPSAAAQLSFARTEASLRGASGGARGAHSRCVQRISCAALAVGGLPCHAEGGDHVLSLLRAAQRIGKRDAGGKRQAVSGSLSTAAAAAAAAGAGGSASCVAVHVSGAAVVLGFGNGRVELHVGDNASDSADPGAGAGGDSSSGALRLAALPREVTCICFAGSSSRVVAGCGNGTALVLAAGAGAPLASLGPHSGAVTAVASSTDGGLIATGDASGKVFLWTASGDRSGEAEIPPASHGNGSGGAAITALACGGGLARLVAIGTARGHVYVCDYAASATAHILTCAAQVRMVAFSPDGSLGPGADVVAAADADGGVQVAPASAITADESSEPLVAEELSSSPAALAVFASGRQGALAVAAIRGDGTEADLLRVPAAAGDPGRASERNTSLSEHPAALFILDAKRVAVLGDGGSLLICTVDAPPTRSAPRGDDRVRESARVALGAGAWASACADPAAGTIAAVTRDGHAVCVDTITQAMSTELSAAYVAETLREQARGDGKPGPWSTVRAEAAVSRRTTAVLVTHGAVVLGCDDGRLWGIVRSVTLASAPGDTEDCSIEGNDSKRAMLWCADALCGSVLALDGNEDVLVAGGAAGRVSVLRLADGAPPTWDRGRALASPVDCVALSGARVAAGTRAGRVAVLEDERGTAMRQWQGSEAVCSLGWVLCGSAVAAALQGGTVRILDAAPSASATCLVPLAALAPETRPRVMRELHGTNDDGVLVWVDDAGVVDVARVSRVPESVGEDEDVHKGDVAACATAPATAVQPLHAPSRRVRTGAQTKSLRSPTARPARHHGQLDRAAAAAAAAMTAIAAGYI